MAMRVGGVVILDEVAAPSAVANFGLIYCKTDGYLYSKNDAGVESRLSGNEIVDSGWQTLTLVNSWANLAGWGTAACRKIDGIVYLRGLLSAGAVGTTMFTLPVGFRPASPCIFVASWAAVTQPATSTPSGGVSHTHAAVNRGSLGGRVDISAAGVCSTGAFQTGWIPSYIGLANINFPAEQ